MGLIKGPIQTLFAIFFIFINGFSHAAYTAPETCALSDVIAKYSSINRYEFSGYVKKSIHENGRSIKDITEKFRVSMQRPRRLYLEYEDDFFISNKIVITEGDGYLLRFGDNSKKAFSELKSLLVYLTGVTSQLSHTIPWLFYMPYHEIITDDSIFGHCDRGNPIVCEWKFDKGGASYRFIQKLFLKDGCLIDGVESLGYVNGVKSLDSTIKITSDLVRY